MNNSETGLIEKALVLTRAFEAVRRGQPNFDLDTLDDTGPDQSFKNDISAIAQGATQQNKAAFSANKQAVNDQEKSVKAEQKAVRDDEARQLQHLMEWNAQKTVVGGIEMTNEEAQDARQAVIDNDDYYARWAVKKGLIRADQIEEFKDGIRRKKDWQHNRGLGTNTADDDAAEAKFDRSDIGKGTTAATAQAHQDKGFDRSNGAERPNADTAMQAKSEQTLSDTPFKLAPKIGPDFSAAKTATVPLDIKPDKTLVPTPPPREIKAMGFDA